MEIEEWRVIESAADYEVSNFGRVRRAVAKFRAPPPRLLSVRLNETGYPIVAVKINRKTKTFKVSRLVCSAFNGPPPTNKHEVAHWDGNKLNNRPSNLRWATRAQNVDDRHRLGEFARGLRHGNGRLTTEQVKAIRASTAQHSAIAAQFGICEGYVYEIKVGKRRKDTV